MSDLIKIESLGVAIIATGLDLIKNGKCLSRNEIEKTLKMHLQQFEIPDLWISDIVSLVIKVADVSDSEPIEEEPSAKTLVEKKFFPDPKLFKKIYFYTM